MVKSLDTVYSVRGKEYRILSVDGASIIGTRPAPAEPFEINTERLYEAYTNIVRNDLPLTTTTLKPYVDRRQSPALAILKTLINR